MPAENLNAGEYLYGYGKKNKLNPVITIILYAGEEDWDGPLSLYDMINFSEIPTGLKGMVSDYRINLIDIRRFENTDVFRTDVKQVFDFIRCSKDKKKLLELVKNDDYYGEMEDDAYDVVVHYTKSKELLNVKNNSGKGGKRDMCKAITDLVNDGREEGREEGVLFTLIGLVEDNLISIEDAAKRANLTVKEFKDKVCVSK